MSEYITQVYDDMKHYIIIALTGRCGSGCSTTRDILSSERKFKPEDYMGSVKIEPDTNIDRDRNIILNFAEKNPLQFEAIRVSDILTSYILENPDPFFEILNQVYPLVCGDGKKIKEDFYHYFNAAIKIVCNNTNFDDISRLSNDIWMRINNNVYQFIERITEQQYDFLFSGISEVSRVIRDFLRQYGDNDQYTTVYQHIGNIIRTYGGLKQVEGSWDFCSAKEEGMYAIAQRINMLIKIMRRKEWILRNYYLPQDTREPYITKSKVHVVIDSIKNVFEAEYLRARYQSFYLIALTLDDETRKQRLKLKKGLNDFQMEVIDVREQPSKAKNLLKKFKGLEINVGNENIINNKVKKEAAGIGDAKQKIYELVFCLQNKYTELFRTAYENGSHIFKMQDVDACIQNADILINNNGTKEELGLKIMRYVCLMQHPGLVPPTADEYYMQVAQVAKLNSGCISRQVGAVVSSRKGKTLSVGWNDAAATEGNECIGCIRRSFDKLVRQEDEAAYSYFELYHTEFREQLKNIMMDSCNLQKETISDEDLYNKFMDEVGSKAQGLPLAFCFKNIYSSMTHDHNQVHTRAQHGEENALETCDRDMCSGGTLYTTSSSCELCAKKALSYNIRRMVYIEPYSGITNDHVLGHAVQNGVQVQRNKSIRKESMCVELFTGATQSAYMRLYTPVFPLKDELKLRGIDLE